MKKVLFFGMLVLAGTFSAIAYNSHISTDVPTETQETYDCKRCGGTGNDPMTQTCPSCRGAKKVKESNYCEKCEGSGQVTDRFGDKVTCPTCKGQRMIINIVTCTTCNGTGDTPMKCMNCTGTGKVNR